LLFFWMIDSVRPEIIADRTPWSGTADHIHNAVERDPFQSGCCRGLWRRCARALRLRGHRCAPASRQHTRAPTRRCRGTAARNALCERIGSSGASCTSVLQNTTRRGLHRLRECRAERSLWFTRMTVRMQSNDRLVTAAQYRRLCRKRKSILFITCIQLVDSEWILIVHLRALIGTCFPEWNRACHADATDRR